MSVELTVVTLLLKALRDDPTATQLKRLNERVERLAYGFYLDGISALEDAVGQQDPRERERLVSLALEYFRQGYSRNEVPWASLCAESVARCYQALGKSQDASRWMRRSWEQLLSAHDAISNSIINDAKDNLKAFKEGFLSPKGLIQMLQRRLIREIFDSPYSIGEQWQNIFLLELQARRLLDQLPVMGIDTDEDWSEECFWFPPDAQRPVYIYTPKKAELVGYITYDGVAHLVHDDSDEELRRVGLSRAQLRPR